MQLFPFTISKFFSVLSNSQRIYWYRDYVKTKFFTGSDLFKCKCKFQFLRKK